MGFTLVELTLVIVLLGILAVVAMPRLDFRGFDEYAFLEESASAVRYARQVAVARNGPVSVVFDATGHFRVCLSDDCPATGGSYLSNPGNGRPWNGSAQAQGRAPSGVTVSAGSVVFNGLGRPDTALDVSLGARRLTVAYPTGHVQTH